MTAVHLAAAIYIGLTAIAFAFLICGTATIVGRAINARNNAAQKRRRTPRTAIEADTYWDNWVDQALQMSETLDTDTEWAQLNGGAS